MSAAAAFSVRCSRRAAPGVRDLHGVGDEADLRGEDRAIAVAPGQRAADQLLVAVRAVHVGGVDQRHAEIERLADDCDGGRVIPRCLEVVGMGHAHAAETDDAHFWAFVA